MSAVPQPRTLLSADSMRRIEREIAKYPAERRQSAVIAALAIAQDQYGWLSQDLIDDVAAVLEMPSIAVYEVASFYAMYNLAPPAKFKLTICTNLPCALTGANRAAAHLKQRLGIGFGDMTADGWFALKEGECLGACGDAPVLLVNNKRMCSFMSDDKLDALLAELKRAK